MSSVSNQNPWAPYDSYRDCSQAICTIYCPQWCYIIFPPPPPYTLADVDGGSGTDISPLIIAIIGILASAFILISYYTIISKYCRRRRRSSGEDSVSGYDENRDQMISNESWRCGLDESVIKSITVCKYKKGDGFVDETDCSVCLSEFEENESLRLLPKCNHAFHLNCIDAWLKSHASCPLCRCQIAPINIMPSQQPPAPAVALESHATVSALEYRYRVSDGVVVVQDIEGGVISVVDDDHDQTPKSRVTNLGLSDNAVDNTRVNDGVQKFRRSVSLNSASSSSSCSSLCDDQVLIGDILRISEINDDVNYHTRDLDKSRNGTMELVRSPLAMRRTISTGQRFIFTSHEKGKNSIIRN